MATLLRLKKEMKQLKKIKIYHLWWQKPFIRFFRSSCVI